MKLMGVNIDAVTLTQAKAALENPQVIFTPNPEILLEAQQNAAFQKALAKGTLMLPDGHGLLLVSTLQKLPAKFLRVLFLIPAFLLFAVWKGPFKSEIPEIIHGSDFMLELVRWSEKNKHSVYFLGAKPGTAERAAKKLQKKFPTLKVAGYSSKDPGETAFELVKKSKAEVLLVAYGAPKQELFIAQYASKIPTLIHAMGVGGSFDFWSGEIRRAPWLMRKLGIEWLWRLFLEPIKRARRIYNATLKFPIKALF